MKKVLLVALFACLTMAFASCNKEKDLNGTTWTCHYTGSMDDPDEGFTVSLDFNFLMEFTSATEGQMTTSGKGIIMGMEIPFEASTDSFSYTFDGTNGSIYDDSTSVAFAYSKEANTITFTQPDEGFGEMVLVFNEKK